jgi:hypothetical protein
MPRQGWHANSSFADRLQSQRRSEFTMKELRARVQRKKSIACIGEGECGG